MSSRDKRLCPGVDGRKCGAYMSPVFRDPHPTCGRCRGRNCARDSTCSSCQDWSLAQWEAFHAKRSYTDRKKSNSRHAGVPTSLTSKSPLSSAAVKQAALSLAPPPLSAPPSSEGSGIGEETKSDNPKQARVSSCPPHPPCCPLSKGEGGNTDNELTEEGNTPPFPPPHPLEGGRMDASPLQSSPILSKALLSPMPNSHIAHPYPRSDKGGERGESRPHSPSSLSKCFQSREGEGKGAGDHSQTEKSRQGTSVPILPPRDRTDILLSVRPLTRSGPIASCRLAVTAIPFATFAVAGHRTGVLLSRCTTVPRGTLVPL